MHRLRNAVLVPVLVLLGLVLSIVALPILLILFLRGVVLRIWFYFAHRRHGRFVLFVYSRSPSWQPYIEQQILPRLHARAVVLNWSERKQWHHLCPWESRVFHQFTGRREFNPVALVFSGRWRVVTIRFYQAFLDLKHGHEAPLRKAEAELFAYLPPAGTAAA